MNLYDHLKKTIPSLGIILDCCSNPSHDLGAMDNFINKFGELKTFLIEHGIKKVLVACPSCYQVFKEYEEGIMVQTVYEYMVEHGKFNGKEQTKRRIYFIF